MSCLHLCFFFTFTSISFSLIHELDNLSYNEKNNEKHCHISQGKMHIINPKQEYSERHVNKLKFLNNLDLSYLEEALRSKSKCGNSDNLTKCEVLIREYKKFLFIISTGETNILVISDKVDDVMHEHVSNLKRYLKDTRKLMSLEDTDSFYTKTKNLPVEICGNIENDKFLLNLKKQDTFSNEAIIIGHHPPVHKNESLESGFQNKMLCQTKMYYSEIFGKLELQHNLNLWKYPANSASSLVSSTQITSISTLIISSFQESTTTTSTSTTTTTTTTTTTESSSSDSSASGESSTSDSSNDMEIYKKLYTDRNYLKILLITVFFICVSTITFMLVRKYTRYRKADKFQQTKRLEALHKQIFTDSL